MNKQPKRSLLHAYTNTLPDSSLRFVLEAFIPYTRANIELAFKPNAFFNHLEYIDRKRQYSRSSLEHAYYKAKQKGYLVPSGKTLQISDQAIRMLEPYVPDKLDRARLIVMFDIPEAYKNQRDRFRGLLRELRFAQVQKSVWSSEYDSRLILRRAIADLDIDDYVDLYEAVSIK